MPLIKGIQKTSLVDYPGKIAATIFMAACNFRCPYCYNSALVDPEKFAKLKTIPEAEILAFLQKRVGLLEGVCLTGGEPTLYADLPEFCRQIKALGFAVKLDTNGTNPQMVEELIKAKLVDYIAMDLKGPLNEYSAIVRMPVDTAAIHRTIGLLLAGNVDYEFRTTVVPGIIGLEQINKMGQEVKGAKLMAIQQFRKNAELLDPQLEQQAPYSSKELQSFCKSLKAQVQNVIVRGVA